MIEPPWLILIGLLFVAGTAVFIFHFLPMTVQKMLNQTGSQSTLPVAIQGKRFPAVDLHADPSLWRRDLLKRNNYGHIDLPRLIEGGVVLQVFAAATKIPLGLNFERNPANRPDLLTWLFLGQRWPKRTWRSLLQRAIFMADSLKQLEEKSNGRFRLIRSAPDLDRLIYDRLQDPHLVGGLLSLEGIHALEGNLDNLDMLFDAGFRIIGLTHFFDNDAGGSAHGVLQGGLTPFGRDLIERIQGRHMILDLAHASPRLLDDVLAIAVKPVIVSHSGFRGIYDSPRNLSDDHARAIAAAGGLIGAAFFPETVGGKSIDIVAQSIRYGVELMGIDHIALGSDFDGAIFAPIDAAGLPHLAAALSKTGFTHNEISQIMADNALQFLRQYLPNYVEQLSERG